MAKTQSRVVRTDEVEPPEESPEDMEALMKESRGGGEPEGEGPPNNEIEVSLRRVVKGLL